MLFLGIDPGKTGWWCLLDSEKKTALARPLTWSADDILIWKNLPKADRIVIEKTHAIPGMMNARSAFTFGFTVGQIHAFTSHLPVSLVMPQAWQKKCLEGIDTKLDTKERSKAAFSRTNPAYRDCKHNHNFTDAYHIATYLIIKNGEQIGGWKWINDTEIWPKFRR